MRLVGGSLPNEGRIEVYYNGEWGTVCSNGWDDSDSSLVCAQLGFKSSTISREFGPGTGRILLDNVMCSSTDVVLANCGHYGVGITINCDHSKDVAIKCHGMYNLVVYCCKLTFNIYIQGNTTMPPMVLPIPSSTVSIMSQSMTAIM